MDVGLNKPFKAGIRKRFQRFMSNEFQKSLAKVDNNVTEEGLAKVDFSKITRVVLATWISEAWNDCRETIVIENTLKHIGYISQ